MPINFDQIRKTLSDARVNREKLDLQLEANTQRLATAKDQQSTLIRSGANAATLSAKTAEIDAIHRERDGLIAERKKLDGIIDNRDTLINSNILYSPQDFIGTLDGGVPLAMLPIRLETRFFDTNQGKELRIRIFPDQIHIDTHTNALTPREADLGRWYWQKKLEANTKTDTAWTKLVKALGVNRALWVVRSLTPSNYNSTTNTLPAGAKPQFPNVAMHPGNNNRTPTATALPDRWFAVGLKKDFTTSFKTIFTCYSKPVPDSLNIGPDFENKNIQTNFLPDELAVDPAMRWLTDFDKAQETGMAITVRDSDLSSGEKLANGVDLLFVFGVDWTLTPEQAAKNLAQLLESHQYSDGMSFIPQGTPTNNTGERRSGFSSAPADAAATIDPIHSPPIDPQYGAAPRLAKALGFATGDNPLERIAGAELSEQRTSSLLIDTLWESTLGYYLDVLIDPFATDTLIALARDHATTHLQPFGPYTTLRIGRQPYGILPVVALDSFEPDREKGIESGLKRLLTNLRWNWEDGIPDVPRMGLNNDPDTDLLALLQQTAVSTNLVFRRAIDTETAANTDGLKNLIEIQSQILRSLVLPIAASFAGVMFDVAKILQLAVHPIAQSLQAPWVQPGELISGRNYINEIAELTRKGTAGIDGLNKSTRSTYALLEILLGHAALRESTSAQLRAALQFLKSHEEILKTNMNTGTTLGIYTQAEESTIGKRFIQTPKQLAGMKITELTKDKNLADYIADQLKLSLAPEKPELRTLANFLQNLDMLAKIPATEIDRCLRGVLDCYAYRYDAWATSLASRRMSDIRAKRPTGINLGGYGWVHDLKPDILPNSLGYVHTPSLNHAITAAILHSGHLSHHDKEAEALKIDLSSKRVRLALNLIEGVAQGQALTALLGYRFERQLHDKNLSSFILPFRKITPLRGTTANTEPSESIAARDVVDGVALIDRWTNQWKPGKEDLAALLKLSPTDPNKNKILAILDDLSDALDAVNDVLTSEALYQTVQGNYERAGAALAALDRQGCPPNPQVVRTPRSGMTYTQRVALVLQDTTPFPGWETIKPDLRAQVEPRLNAWIGRILGKPNRFLFAAQLQRNGKIVSSLSLTLTELGLSPLSLALLCNSSNTQKPSTLEMCLAARFAAKVTTPDPTLELVLLDAPPTGSGGDILGFGPFLAQLRLINTFIAKRRPLDARDLFPPENETTPGFQLDELRNRLMNVALPTLTAAIKGLETALAPPTADPNKLRAALLAAAAMSNPDAFPDTAMNDAKATQALITQAKSACKSLKQTNQQLQDRIEQFQRKMPKENDPTYPIQVVKHYTACLRLILGESFPVLPLFTPTNTSELNASRAEKSTLLNGDLFAPISVLQQMAHVRPEIDALSAMLTACDLLGNGMDVAEWSVMQLPHVKEQRWAALPKANVNPLLSLITLGRYNLLTPTTPSTPIPIAGLICDGWSETIPSDKETTAIGFHYDAPAARPPQTVLLMAPPDLNQVNWSYDTVVATLLETWKLMQLRAIGPKQVRTLGGGMLPALYLPQDDTYQVPSVDLIKLADRYRSNLIGKTLDEQ